MINYIDLHIHSIYSDDGEFTVLKLMEKCQAAGIRIMSITDHNSVKANKEAKKISKDYGIKYINGIEVDCTYKGTNLHLLGYDFNENSIDFEIHEDKIMAGERAASTKRLTLTRELGFQVLESELNTISNLDDGKIWVGETFAEVLLGKPEYESHELLLPYRKGGERSDNPYVNFYWDYYSQNKPCYVHVDFPTFQEAISLIQRNGGKAVLAHPGKSIHRKGTSLNTRSSSLVQGVSTKYCLNFEKNKTILEEMVSFGLDGVEVYCSYHSFDTAKVFYEIAMDLGLSMTCGSDFHGKAKPMVTLGGYDFSLVADSFPHII